MTKTKRQLRAGAVERLSAIWRYEPLGKRKLREDLLADDEPELAVRNEASDDELFRCSYCHCEVRNIDMTEGDCGYGLTFCPQCGGEIDESDSRRIDAKLGEPTNGIGGETNGIRADAPLANGTRPNGNGACPDAVGHASDDCGQNADMSGNAPGCVRDGASASGNGVGDGPSVLRAIGRLRYELSDYHGHLKAYNDLQRHCDNQRRRIAELEALYAAAKGERDEWKAKAKHAPDCGTEPAESVRQADLPDTEFPTCNDYEKGEEER